MSFLLPPPAPAVPEGAWPVNFGRFGGLHTSFNIDVTNTHTGSLWIVTCVDATCTGAEPVQCFCSMTANSVATVFYDSQSTGEGVGVSFFYRGQIVLAHSDDLEVLLTSSATINMGIAISGYVIPQPPDTP